MLRKKRNGKKKKKFTTEIVRGFDEKIYRDILDIRKKSFESDFLFEDEEEYFKEKLHDKETIQIILRCADKRVGYLLAISHNEAQSDIADDDKKMKPSENRFYIDTMSIIPEYRGDFGFLQMILALIKEAKKRGVTKFSAHVRKTNKLSQKIKLLFGDSITEFRHIDSWKYAGGEPYDYLEADFKHSLLKLKLKIFAYKVSISLKRLYDRNELRKEEKRYRIFSNSTTKSDDLDAEDFIRELYTPLDVAQKEIFERSKNVELQKKLRNFLGDVPTPFKKEIRAVIARNIATPDFEFQHMRNISEATRLTPLYIESTKDKFCTLNPDKLFLGKLAFFHCRDDKGKCVVTRKTIFDIEKYDGKPMDKIVTYSGEKLVDLHHRLFSPIFSDVECFDIFNWLKKHGKNARQYYPYYLALFVCYGVLFETYLVKSLGTEKKFALEVIKPAFELVTRELGVKPLIVNLFENVNEEDIFWYCHPQFLMKEI